VTLHICTRGSGASSPRIQWFYRPRRKSFNHVQVRRYVLGGMYHSRASSSSAVSSSELVFFRYAAVTSPRPAMPRNRDIVPNIHGRANHNPIASGFVTQLLQPMDTEEKSERSYLASHHEQVDESLDVEGDYVAFIALSSVQVGGILAGAYALGSSTALERGLSGQPTDVPACTKRSSTSQDFVYGSTSSPSSVGTDDMSRALVYNADKNSRAKSMRMSRAVRARGATSRQLFCRWKTGIVSNDDNCVFRTAIFVLSPHVSRVRSIAVVRLRSRLQG
jgi:hypothetical protein